MKIILTQLLFLSLFAMHATSLPRESVTMQHALEPRQQAAAVAVVNESSKPAAAEPAVVVDAVQLSPSSADQLPSIVKGECVNVGENCSLPDECCTKRCLTYAKKCVT
ncbi:uncharacterized protein LOC101457792 [Ceratitis capitata]|uniref:uncharacterized protein LOC101457792 n=1 Tax=Ceratitis capitata TaxID=7213 RepID=UPI000A10F7FB|nr:uncharacterized protein LOC101457792 [Ceratitis capitata]